jgi:hypothetical protein
MTEHAPKILPNMTDERPCIVKVTHAMGSLGIFVIKDDSDVAEFEAFVAETGNPEVVTTEFVSITRNLACHFFVHPDGTVTWFGYSENLPVTEVKTRAMSMSDPASSPPRYSDVGEIKWSSDSTFVFDLQADMQALLSPYALDTARYMLSQGFWGFAGIDVLFDKFDKGYVVDVNPRVTGSMPALLVSCQVKQKYGFTVGKFRKSTKWIYSGSVSQLLAAANEWNDANTTKGHVVLFSVFEKASDCSQLNIAVWSNSDEECQEIFALFCEEGAEGRA